MDLATLAKARKPALSTSSYHLASFVNAVSLCLIGNISARASLKDNMLSLYQDIPWTGCRHAHVVIQSIGILSYREDRCFLPATAFLNPHSRRPEHDKTFRMPWHMPFVWIPHPGLPSAPSLSFPEPPHKPASVHGNDPSRGVRQGNRYALSVPCSEPCQGLFPWSGSACVWKALTVRMWQFWHPYLLWLQWYLPNVPFLLVYQDCIKFTL